MLQYPEINPVAISIGPLSVHWYGLMYLTAFAAAWWLGRKRASLYGWKHSEIEEVILYGALGVVLGGRLGYILFYNFSTFIDNPLILFRVWEGGMSFHGGLIGVLIAMFLFGKKYNRTFYNVMDFIAPLVPIGLGAGRIGNFINSELWGKPTDLPWAMVFPNGGPFARHPSMLYEAFLEGVVLFVIVWWYSAKPRPPMAVASLFAIGYGVFRFIVEFVREPDAHIGYLAFGWLTMGQLLSLPLILAGMIVITISYKNQSTGKNNASIS
jgi:phosphatidylglycerol:prolipoprotein diacylglycerol transferase